MNECKCTEILLADETRHFRGCPLRTKYPMHEAEKRDMPGPIVMEFLAWIRAQELWGCSLAYADETICAEFFAQRIEVRRGEQNGNEK